MATRQAPQILRALIGVGAFMLLAIPARAAATPDPVPATYMHGTTLPGLKTNAYNVACHFANVQPGSTNRIMMLDFGALRKVDSNNYGALDFDNTLFSNGDILEALKRAADGYHNCYDQGSNTQAIISYGSSSDKMHSLGNLSNAEAHDAGAGQVDRGGQLYQYELSQGYSHEGAGAGSDMEVGWNPSDNTSSLVDGAVDNGSTIFLNYGDAQGCPASGNGGTCDNGWHVNDVAYISQHGSGTWGTPEIYFTVNADQWTVVRKNWNSNHSTQFVFYGSTGETGPGADLSSKQGWDALSSRNSNVVNELICFGC